MTKTRDKILIEAVNLFNEQGIDKVTIRDIAVRVGISSGNLAYHFKNKDVIIEEIFKMMEEERAKKLSSAQIFPSFENANRQALEIVELSIKYRFFFLDTLDILRKHPKLAETHRKYIDAHIKYVRSMLQHSENTGHLKSEVEKEIYNTLAESVWMMLQFWLINEAIRGKEFHDAKAAVKAMWSLVMPYLTEKGKNKILAVINHTEQEWVSVPVEIKTNNQ
jgi:AcrR family transcriptional regulator